MGTMGTKQTLLGFRKIAFASFVTVVPFVSVGASEARSEYVSG
jgi:hypothetical protein